SDMMGVNVDVVLTSTCVGAGSGTFMLSSASGLTNLNLDLAKTITVNYAPSTRGARSCVVNVNTTGTGTTLYTFTVAGTGIAPVASAPSSLSFAATRWNDMAVTTTSSQSLTITNNGDTGQTLSVMSLPISGSGDFTVSGGPMFPA